MGPRILVTILLMLLAGCVGAQPAGPQTAEAPGWTGRTTVLGTSSTIAGDAVSTNDQQKWSHDRH